MFLLTRMHSCNKCYGGCLVTPVGFVIVREIASELGEKCQSFVNMSGFNGMYQMIAYK